MRPIRVILGLLAAFSAPAAHAGDGETVIPAGVYRLEMREVHASRFPLLGKTRTTWASVALARVRVEGGTRVQEHRLCDVRFESGLPLVEMVMPDPMRDSLGRAPYPVALERNADGTWSYRADLGFEYVGYAPATAGAPPPLRGDDPAVVDSDGDGKPGATLHLEVPVLDPLELYVVQRGHAVLEGTVLEDGRVEGGVSSRIDQVVVGSDPYFLKRNPKLEPEPELSRFVLSPVPEGSSCESLLDAPKERTAEGVDGTSPG